MTHHAVAVKALCAFVARSGDLDLRFTPVPTAPEGMAGHRAVVFSRPSDYLSEVSIEGVVDGLLIRGRIDGVTGDGLTLDEIKTFRGHLDRVPGNHRALHRAQLRTYGALYARTRKLPKLTLRVCYYDIDRRAETHVIEEASADDLWAELEVRVALYKRWLAGERAHRERRDTQLSALAFPYSEVPVGQRQLMQAVEHSFLRGECLLAQAPTGVGKTLGVLFPSLKALGAGVVDQLYYLTTKNAVQSELQGALDHLTSATRPLALRVLLLTAKERACVHPDKACHGASCPLAQGFFDRLPAAREVARGYALLDLPQLSAIARAHQLCPYFLAQEMTQWADLVVGDVNYYLDVHALLYALTTHTGTRVAVLIDEAHNLVERARAMYSIELTQTQLHAGSESLPKTLRPVVGSLMREMDDLAARHPHHPACPALLEEAPKSLRAGLSQAISKIGHWFAEQPDRATGAPLQLYFELIAFQRLVERLGTHSLFEVEQRGTIAQDLLARPDVALQIRNVVPAPHLIDRFKAATAVVAFSATLTPAHYHQLMCGLPEDARFIDLPSRFAVSQLQVTFARNLRTEWRVRDRTAPLVAAAIGAMFAEQPGNYWVFCSSFAYLEAIAAAFSRQFPDIATCRQQPQMQAPDRDAFLARFTERSQQIGFVVLGGSFSEGINLEGARLIGAVICNLGLPPFTLSRQRMAERIDRYFVAGAGDDFTYLYPAIIRIIQAAGRVIRTTEDHGRLLLIDERFSQARVQRLLPSTWLSGNRTGQPAGLRSAPHSGTQPDGSV